MKMKNNYYLIVFVLLLIVPSKIFANCTYENISKLKNMATNVNYDYIYAEKDQSTQFQIRFTNLNSSIYIYDENNKKTYYEQDGAEMILTDFDPGSKYKFHIKPYAANVGDQTVTVKIIENGEWVEKIYVTGLNNSACNETLYTFYVNLPYYNKFYSDKLCNGLEKYEICQKWSQNNFTYDQFKSEISKLKDGGNTNGAEKKENSISLIQEIINILVQYYYIIIILVILIAISLTVLIKRRKNGFEGW